MSSSSEVNYKNQISNAHENDEEHQTNKKLNLPMCCYRLIGIDPLYLPRAANNRSPNRQTFHMVSIGLAVATVDLLLPLTFFAARANWEDRNYGHHGHVK